MENSIRDYISLLFDGYKLKKQENRLYKNDDEIPKIIIKQYLDLVEKPAFNDLITDYKNRYIVCESKVEPNFTKEEQQGLADVYDFIQNFDFDKMQFNVFITTLTMHNKLFAHCGVEHLVETLDKLLLF